jgi:hypothetical protein
LDLDKDGEYFPYLMFEDKNSSSPLKLAIENKNIMLVDKLLELCIN